MSDEVRRARIIFEAEDKGLAKTTARANEGVASIGESAAKAAAKAKEAAKATDLIAKAAGEVAAAHTRQADQIAREIQLLRAAGGAQASVSAKVREEIQLRSKAAAVLGQTVQQAKLLQRAEVEAIKSTTAQRKAADSEAAAAQRALAAQRKAATAEQVATLKAEALALREQHQVLRAIGGEAQKIHDLRQRELAILQKAATLAGQTGRAQQLGSTAHVESAQFGAGQQSSAREGMAARSAANAQAEAARFAAEGYKGADASARKFFGTLQAGLPAVQSIGTSLKDIGLAAMGIGALGGALGAAAQAVDQLATDSLQAQRVSANLQISISGAAAAFDGYVDNVTLAKAANKAYQMGVVTNSKEFETIARGVNVLAIKLGEDQAQLLDNAVTAIGRQSRLILDNLGIILDNAKAERIFAESIGKTVDQLDAYEKSIAFSKAATILIGQAADETGVKVEGMAASFAQSKVALENLRQGVLGFDESLGQTREAIRGLTDEQLERLSFADFADETSKIGKEVNGYLAQWGVTIENVDQLSQKLGISFEDLIAQEERRREAESGKVARKAFEENKKARLEGWVKEADAIEHEIALRKILGIKDKDLIGLQVQQLELRLNAAEAAGDLVETLKIQRQIETATLEAATKKAKSGGASGPTQADRIRAAGEAQIQVLRGQLVALEQAAELVGQLEESSYGLAEQRLAIKLAELQVEREALEATKAKNAVERQQIATKLSALDAETEATKRSAVLDARKEEIALISKATAEIQAKVAAEANEQARIVDMSTFRLRAAGDEIKLREQVALQSAKTDTERFEIVDRAATASHQNRLAQIRAERDAQLRELDVREDLLRAQSGLTDEEKIAREDQLRQTAHDREMTRLQADLDLRRAVGEEQARLAAQAEATLTRQLDLVNQSVGVIEGVHGELMSKIGDFQGRRRAAEAADLQAWQLAQEAKAEAQINALDRELDATQNNAALTAKINRQKAAIQRQTALRLQKAQADHDRKVEREQQRSEGIQLLVQGAVSTVKAAAAYPNIPAIIAHAAAAALAFSYGGMLLAGQVPSAKAGSALSSSSGAGGSLGATGQVDRETSEASRMPDSVPGKAAAANRFRSRSSTGEAQAGVVVNINGDIKSLGSIDAEAAEQIGVAVAKATYQREGSSG